MSAKPRNSALLVLGMHRSGTSALAGMLSLCGADPGPSLMPGVAGVNPKGFWEHQEIVAIHERLLGMLHSAWDDERPLPSSWWQLPEVAVFRDEILTVLRRDFAASPLWLLKDPRLCRLLPLWLDMLEELDVTPHFVICLRHPGEVAMSLERRDGISAARATLLWLQHLVDGERGTRNLPRLVVAYEQLLADWRATLQQIAARLSIALPLDDAAADRIDAFLEPALRHHRHGQEGTTGNDRLFALASEAFELATGKDIDAAAGRFDVIREQTAALAEQVAPWSAEICALKKENAQLTARTMQLEAANADLQAEIDRVKSTVSWLITRPLRFLAFLWRKLVGTGRSS
jgi:hypothetical protein